MTRTSCTEISCTPEVTPISDEANTNTITTTDMAPSSSPVSSSLAAGKGARSSAYAGALSNFLLTVSRPHERFELARRRSVHRQTWLACSPQHPRQRKRPPARPPSAHRRISAVSEPDEKQLERRAEYAECCDSFHGFHFEPDGGQHDHSLRLLLQRTASAISAHVSPLSGLLPI